MAEPPNRFAEKTIAALTRAIVGPEPEPSVTRFAAIRVPAAAGVEASNRYMQPAAAEIADDLRALGVDPAGLDEAAEILQRFLGSTRFAGFDQTPAAAQTRLVELFDRAYLPPADRPDVLPLRRTAGRRDGS